MSLELFVGWRTKFRGVFWGSFVSLIFATCSYASPYINPYHQFDHDNSYAAAETIGLYVGVDDDKIFGSNGIDDAMSIGNIMINNYGYSLGLINSGLYLTTDVISENMAMYDTMIHSTFDNVKNFIFYIGGHGRKGDDDHPNKILLESKKGNYNQDNVLTDMQLATYLQYLPRRVNKIVLIDSCYSGGFIPELEGVKNISIITSATSGTESLYDKWSGRSYFSMSIEKFLNSMNGSGFSFDELAHYLKSDSAYSDYIGRESYTSDIDDPLEDSIIFTSSYWNVEIHESTPVPEPSTLFAVSVGFLALLFSRMRLVRAQKK